VTFKGIEATLYRAADKPMPAGHRSIADRFAVPHNFPPDLTVPEAMIRVAGALTRIFLGSLLFAVWGVGAAVTLRDIPNLFLRIAAFIPLLGIFVAALTMLMLAITALVHKISPTHAK
jgi:hypothetical protein